MIKKINKFVDLSIIASIIFTIIGLCLIIFPDVSLNIMSYVIGGLFLIFGIYLFTINYNSLILTDMIFFGVMMVLLGVILIVYPKLIAQLIPIVLGIWFITDSIVKIRISLSLKDCDDTPWVLTLVLSIISMLIFVGIVSGLPSAAVQVFNLAFKPFTTANFLIALAIIIGAILLIAAVVFVQEAERKIPVQYAKKVVGRKMYGGQNTHIPLKLAMAGVMPIIFASSFMTFPAMMIQIFASDKIAGTGFLAGLYKFSIATSTSSVG